MHAICSAIRQRMDPNPFDFTSLSSYASPQKIIKGEKYEKSLLCAQLDKITLIMYLEIKQKITSPKAIDEQKVLSEEDCIDLPSRLLLNN